MIMQAGLFPLNQSSEGEFDMAFGTKDSGSGNFGSYSADASSSFFGKTMKIEGEVTSDEDLTIEGKVDGELKVSKTLTIGKDGYVKGKINAAVVQISGEAEGYVRATKKLEISSEGKYTGDIQSDTIRVAEGAKIKGSINLQDNSVFQETEVQPEPEPQPESEPSTDESTEENPPVDEAADEEEKEEIEEQEEKEDQPESEDAAEEEKEK